ncbi:MAG: hypothetical protein RR623_06970 [Bacilli bacterium]
MEMNNDLVIDKLNIIKTKYFNDKFYKKDHALKLLKNILKYDDVDHNFFNKIFRLLGFRVEQDYIVSKSISDDKVLEINKHIYGKLINEILDCKFNQKIYVNSMFDVQVENSLRGFPKDICTYLINEKFKRLGEFVIDSKYSTITSCIKDIFNEGILDTDYLPAKLTGSSSFGTVKNSLLRSQDIIEISSTIFASKNYFQENALQQLKSDIKTEIEKQEEYFSLKMIMNGELESNELVKEHGESLVVGLLKFSFRLDYFQYSKQFLFRKTSYKEYCDLNNFVINYYLERTLPIDIDIEQNTMYLRYGFTINDNDVIQILTDEGFYYDKNLRKIFSSKEECYREIYGG